MMCTSERVCIYPSYVETYLYNFSSKGFLDPSIVEDPMTALSQVDINLCGDNIEGWMKVRFIPQGNTWFATYDQLR